MLFSHVHTEISEVINIRSYELNEGAGYGRHIQNTAAICNSSAYHTYGNVMSVVEQFILHQFPANLFKTVTSSTSLANEQMKHTPRQLYKHPSPMMIMSPRVVFGQEDNRFLGNTRINSRVTNLHNTYGEGSLLELANDKLKNMIIHGSFNRAVLYVDFVLSFETYAQQMNYMHHMHQMIPINHNQFITAPLELFIPSEFCKLISGVSGVPIMDEAESVNKFSRYMNAIWNHPVTFKLKGSNNSNEFFMYYLADIDIVIQEPTAGPGVKDGQLKRNFDITFTTRCEFNTVGYFTLNSPNFTKPSVLPDASDAVIYPLFSDFINLQDFNLPLGWEVFSWPIFKLSHGDNSISLKTILNKSLDTVIDHHLMNNIPMSTFIKVEFRENGHILNDEMFFIDWRARTLTVNNPNIHRTYRLIISVSPEYINNLIKETFDLD